MRNRDRPRACAADDAALVGALQAGDESIFAQLNDAYGEPMLRIAIGIVSSRAVAEEVVQETWLAVFTGIHRFEGRSSLRTWIFRILMNTANTQRTRDARSVAFSELGAELSSDEPAVTPERFLPPDHQRGPGSWASPPSRWSEDPESRLLSAETLGVIRRAIGLLPPGQRAVVTLRDVQGWTAEEVSKALGLSGGNQRVLLHRARSRIRAALELRLSVQQSAAF